MANEPGAAVLALFYELIDRIKQRNPAGSNDQPVNTRVYSQLVMGMPIYREDYFKPWTPAGGASLRDAPPPAANPQALAADPQLLRAMQAAWKTSLLCRTMLKVTKDDSYSEYPIGRHLDFAFDSVLFGVHGKEVPPESEEIKQRRLRAQKVLYKTEADGSISSWEKTPLYQNYLKNTRALAKAKSDYAVAQTKAMVDPIAAAAWPVESATYQQAVDEARDALVAEGSEQVEAALASLNSIGIPAEQRLIDKAKEAFDAWNLGLTGVVPAKSPYSIILPTNWCDPDDHDGWETLTVDRSSYQHYGSQSSSNSSASSWESHASSTSGGGGVILGFAAFGGSGGSGSSGSSWQSSSSSSFHSGFHNDASNLSIEMEFGMCTMIRPWLTSDLFYLRNWYLKNNRKFSISDGTIDGQVNSQEKLLPMIPQQFLVVRNVRISTTHWGSDGEMLSNYYGSAAGTEEARNKRIAGSGGVSLGFVTFGGSADHTASSASGESHSWESRSSSDHFGTTFDGETLHMPGAQIVAFLSDITPASPLEDDPDLPSQ